MESKTLFDSSTRWFLLNEGNSYDEYPIQWLENFMVIFTLLVYYNVDYFLSTNFSKRRTEGGWLNRHDYDEGGT